MSKKYISKVTGNIAIQVENYYTIHTSDDDPLSGKYVIATRMIEEYPENREEIGNSWVDKAFEEIKFKTNQRLTNEEFMTKAKEIVVKHAPKEVRFTEQDIRKGMREIYTDGESNVIWNAIRYFLKQHNLYDE